MERCIWTRPCATAHFGRKISQRPFYTITPKNFIDLFWYFKPQIRHTLFPFSTPLLSTLHNNKYSHTTRVVNSGSGATFTVAVGPLLLAESSGDSSAATFLAV